jgi:hypothetical protein
MLQVKSTANVSTTTELLNKYLGEQLKAHSIDPKFGAYAMENTFGEKIHAQVEGFCKFAEESGFFILPLRLNNDGKKEVKNLIKIILSHDLVGGLNNDKLMLPRVDGYENK